MNEPISSARMCKQCSESISEGIPEGLRPGLVRIGRPVVQRPPSGKPGQTVYEFYQCPECGNVWATEHSSGYDDASHNDSDERCLTRNFL
jgi:hypothetical protein